MLEGAFTNVLLGVAGNALWALVSPALSGVTKGLKAEFQKELTLGTSDSVSDLLGEAVRGLSQVASFGDAQIENFLCSPEVEAMIFQMYSGQLDSDLYEEHIRKVREQFLITMALQLGVSVDQVEERGGQLFNAVRICCDGCLQQAVEDGYLSAHEVLATRRDAIVRDMLKSIDKRLDYLQKLTDIDLPSILEFEVEYRKQVADRFKSITPPQFDKRVRFPIDDLYVCPDFMDISPKSEQHQQLALPDFLSRVYRTVVLGNPGAGKSTFAGKLCHDLASNYEARLLAGRQLTPVLVILREYGEQKKEGLSILQSIERTAVSDFQLSVPKGALEYLLRNNRVLLIFDGLDELVDTYDRDKVRQDIESFCNRFPSVPVLVTSRSVGYDQAPLDRESFTTYELMPFSDEKVVEYARKWFSTDPDIPPATRLSRASDFVKQSESVRDLRSNPLMLALMCSLYWEDSYIPRNRPELYAKCSEMLFEKWDKHRHISRPLIYEAHLQPVVQYLAHWIYGDVSLQKGVTESLLIEKTTECLVSEVYDNNRTQAERVAKEFVEYCCKGRAWVFSDTGLRQDNQSLYEFTHRSFMEYFTAGYLVTVNYTPELLWNAIKPRIAAKEWDLVAQLALQIQGHQVKPSTEMLLTWLLESADAAGSHIERSNYLHFAVRSLEFLVPKQTIVQTMTAKCISYGITWNSSGASLRPGKQQPISPAAMMNSLLWCRNENRDAITEQIINGLGELITGTDVELAVRAAELGLLLERPLGSGKRSTDEPTNRGDLGPAIVNQLLVKYEAPMIKLAASRFGLSLMLLWCGKVSPRDFLAWHGTKSLFRRYRYQAQPGATLMSAAEYLLGSAEASQPLDLEGLIWAGQAFLSAHRPWFSGLATPPSAPYPRKADEAYFATRFRNLSGDAAFGLWCILAPVVEAQPKSFEASLVRYIPGEKRLMTLLGKYQYGNPNARVAAAKDLGLSPAQWSLVHEWLDRNIELVAKHPEKQISFALDEW